MGTHSHTYTHLQTHTVTHTFRNTHTSKFRQKQRSHGLKWSGKVAWAGNWSMSDRKTYPYICECLQAKGHNTLLFTHNAGTVLRLSNSIPSHRPVRHVGNCRHAGWRKRREASSCGCSRHSTLDMAPSSALWSTWLTRMLLHRGLPHTQMPTLAWPGRQGK